MKCESLFCGKNKKNIVNLSPAELVQKVVKVKKNNKNVIVLRSKCIFSQALKSDTKISLWLIATMAN